MSKRKKTCGRPGLSRGVVERAAKESPPWEWPLVARRLAAEHGVTETECLNRLAAFPPWFEGRDGSRQPVLFDGVFRTLGVPATSLMTFMGLKVWEGSLAWDPEERCFGYRESDSARRVEDTPESIDTELYESLFLLAEALGSFSDARDRHDHALGVQLLIPEPVENLGDELTEFVEKLIDGWGDALSCLHESVGREGA